MPLQSTRGGASAKGFGFGAGGSPFIIATGGTVLTCGDYKTHVFTGPGSFVVSNLATPTGGPNTVVYFVVAGGGGVNGAGGFRVSNCATRSGLPAPSMSPLVTSTGITLTKTTFPITVGAGGVGPGPTPTIGNPSIFSTITSAGGGIAVNGTTPNPNISGGSGGGGGAYVNFSPQVQSGGSGNTPPVSPSQGNPGANLSGLVNPSGSSIAFGGGGGAGAAGSGPITVTNVSMSPDPNGGIGSFVSNNFFGPTSPSYGTPGPAPVTRYFAGGGSGFAQRCAGTNTGSGVGGAGGGGGTPGAVDGGTNTGGAGGLVYGLEAGAGGSGIVAIRYKYK